ncbi:hypothetical protein AFLA_001121 [Aspergillus flavus NRRL3357]|nr:hypothetical protein AFLA_001121 [Aspergillus flavus NRRL3357]
MEREKERRERGNISAGTTHRNVHLSLSIPLDSYFKVLISIILTRTSCQEEHHPTFGCTPKQTELYILGVKAIVF